MDKQSSILSAQELHLLASHSDQTQHNTFRVYSYQHPITIKHAELHLADSIEALLLMLRGCPLGIAVILPSDIESQPKPLLDELITLFKQRADIRVFWLGELPSMQTNLPVFVHCHDACCLHDKISQWMDFIAQLFSTWIREYRVAFVTENNVAKRQHQADFVAMGLTNIHYFNAKTAITDIAHQQLLIIDLEVPSLHLIDILKELQSAEWFPIIIIYGRLPANVCNAAYTFIENSGFPILASLTEIPDKSQWKTLFSSLFDKVYRKNWVNEEAPKTDANAHKVYDLATQSVTSYFCLHGMCKKQINSLAKTKNIRHIIHLDSIKDWFPDGGKRDLRLKIASQLGCDPYSLDICIESPENIARTSSFFSGLLMVRLENTKVYWRVENENNLLPDILKNYPISDVILCNSLSQQLLSEPSQSLLDFIEQAQIEQVNVIVTLQPSNYTREALALYGIESVLGQ